MAHLRILVADDSPEFRQHVRLMLAHEPEVEVVVVARDGQEAVELARRVQPTVAVVDLNMPRLDGFSALRELARVSPQTGFMLVTGNQDQSVRREAESYGVHEVLLKPFTPNEFMAAIRRTAAHAAEKESPRTLAQEVLAYLKIGRMDDEASRVYAGYIRQPHAEPDLLARLAEIFCARRDWSELRHICERMEQFGSDARDQ
jgi:DNA-binding NarL/FixJ family response regulator